MTEKVTESGIYVMAIAILLGALLVSMSVFMTVGGLSNDMKELKTAVGRINVTCGAAAPAAEVVIEENNPPATGVTDVRTVDGNYVETTESVCKNGSAVIVRLYATTWCVHCQWEKPILQNVSARFGDKVDLRIYEVDVDAAKMSASEMALWQKYNPDGTIPTPIIGCKYYKVGSGESLGAAAEAAAITKLICSELGNDAPEFCASS